MLGRQPLAGLGAVCAYRGFCGSNGNLWVQQLHNWERGASAIIGGPILRGFRKARARHKNILRACCFGRPVHCVAAIKDKKIWQLLGLYHHSRGQFRGRPVSCMFLPGWHKAGASCWADIAGLLYVGAPDFVKAKISRVKAAKMEPFAIYLHFMDGLWVFFCCCWHNFGT